MENFKYSLISKIVYRYGNIIATLLLSVHFISSLFIMFDKWYFAFFAAINGFFIWIINKYFFKTYKLFPFNITADNEKIICSDYFMSSKKIEILHKDIDQISGGIFSGYPTRPIYIHDRKNDITIGFYSHVGNFQKLLTKILQNIPQNLYNDLMDRIKSFSGYKKK